MQNNICFKVLILTVFVSVTGISFINAQTGTYIVDQDQSKISFRVSHMGALKVNGYFSQYSGQFIFSEEELLTLNCAILVKSVNTNNEERDGIIKNEAYFDIDNYPWILFKSDDFIIEANKKTLKGLLRIKETEKILAFPYDLIYDKALDQVKLMAETEISRKDFNLVFGTMNGLIGNEVHIRLEIIANSQ